MQGPIVLTGGTGFVAGSVIRQTPEDVALHVLSRGAALVERPGLHWHTLDTLDERALRDTVTAIRPRAIIHTAAMAAIDYCEAHKEEAWAVNVTFTERLAALADTFGARLVYTSTDNAFDGVEGRYTESDPATPINYYGETKVAAERVVEAMGDRGVIGRVALVMGLPMLGTGNSFLSRMIPVLEQGEMLGVPDQEVRSPIDVITLGQALLELTDFGVSGYLHLAGNDIVNRCKMARRVAMALGYDGSLVRPTDPRHLPGRAPRPRDVSLLNTRARNVLKTPMCGIESAVGRILALRPS